MRLYHNKDMSVHV